MHQGSPFGDVAFFLASSLHYELLKVHLSLFSSRHGHHDVVFPCSCQDNESELLRFYYDRLMLSARASSSDSLSDSLRLTWMECERYYATARFWAVLVMVASLDVFDKDPRTFARVVHAVSVC